MLEPNYLINQLGAVTTVFSDLHTDILRSITKRMTDTLKAIGELGVMPSTLKQIETAQATGLLYDDIIRHIAEAMAVAQSEIRELFDEASVEALRYDNQIYREAGLPDALVNQSPEMQRILKASIEKQMGSLHRMTGTIATNSQELFERILNTAYMKTVSGTHSYTEALGEGVRDMLREGVTVFSYKNNRKISVEAAILMNIRTGVSQTAAEITKQGMIERGLSYVEVSAHMGARNTGEGHRNHESWQGKVFHWKELEDEPGFNHKSLPNKENDDIIERERKKILDGTYPSRIIQGRQNKHIEGTKEFEQNRDKMQRLSPGSEPSMLTADAQALVDKHKGTGFIEEVKGSLFPREIIDLDSIVGQTWVKSLNKYIDTKKIRVVYSSTGVHVIPISDFKKA